MEKGTFDCLKCVHFYVTWDRAFPRGCRQFDFKTSGMPSRDVLMATGRPCPSYNPKEKG